MAVITKTIYLVINSGGEWEDSWSNNIIAFTSEESANGYVEDQEAREVKEIAAGKILSEFAYLYQTENLKPRSRKSGIRQQDITAEMRLERTRILELNKAISNIQNDKTSNEFFATMLEKQRKFAIENGIEPPDYIIWIPKEPTDWSVEPLSFIEED